MRTATKKGILGIITLVAVIAMAGSASAIEPVTGDVNSSVAQGQVVTLTVEGGTPGRYVTAVCGPVNPTLNDYAYSDIDPLLIDAGIPWLGTFNITVVMLCSGTQCDEMGVMGSDYTNTFRNTTPSTAVWMEWQGLGVRNGAADYLDPMELEPCEDEKPSFNKTLYAGWNLISLPLAPSNTSASAVLSGVYQDAVYTYNATLKEYEIADVMDSGTGYFVNVTADCEWAYSGDAHTSMEDVSLKHGLNMVGWLNCSKDFGDALSAVAGEYHYVARWNTSAEKFEVYNPAAPDPAFNDFTTMDRGIGYFIAAKQCCVIDEIC